MREAKKITDSEALGILINSRWMCLSGNSDDFQKAIEYGFESIKKNDELQKEVNRLNNLIKIMIEEHDMFPNLDECTTQALKQEIKRRRIK